MGLEWMLWLLSGRVFGTVVMVSVGGYNIHTFELAVHEIDQVWGLLNINGTICIRNPLIIILVACLDFHLVRICHVDLPLQL